MESVTVIVKAITRGFYDSLKGTIVLFYLDKNIKEKAEKGSPLRRDNFKDSSKKSDSLSNKNSKVRLSENKVLKRTWQCCLLNGGVFWLSILLFEYAILPIIAALLSFIVSIVSPSTPDQHPEETSLRVWSWVRPIISVTFGAFWVVPLFLLSKIVNALWFQDIADSAYRYSRGRPQYFAGFGKFIADALFSILVQFFFLMQSILVDNVGLGSIGTMLSLIHMCLLYSLYSFEYKWYNMGWELHKRLSFIESNWPYFIGFGLPLAILTSLTSSYIISGCIFSILFPLFIISANEANPISNVSGIPLSLFAPLVTVSNALFNRTMKSKAMMGGSSRIPQGAAR